MSAKMKIKTKIENGMKYYLCPDTDEWYPETETDKNGTVWELDEETFVYVTDKKEFRQSRQESKERLERNQLYETELDLMPIEVQEDYEQRGEFWYPKTQKPTGMYADLREKFLKTHRPEMYQEMKADGTLYRHLQEVEDTTTQQIENFVQKMAQADGTDEKLKATNQMEWVGLMNNYRLTAQEIFLKQNVYD